MYEKKMRASRNPQEKLVRLIVGFARRTLHVKFLASTLKASVCI